MLTHISIQTPGENHRRQQSVFRVGNLGYPAVELCDGRVDLRLSRGVIVSRRVAANRKAAAAQGVDRFADFRTLYMKNGLKRFA